MPQEESELTGTKNDNLIQNAVKLEKYSRRYLAVL